MLRREKAESMKNELIEDFRTVKKVVSFFKGRKGPLAR